MREAVIVEAQRTPIGKGKPVVGWLSGFHAIEVLALSIEGVLKKAGVDRKEVEQVVAGCVTQAGEQASNIGVTTTRWAASPQTASAGPDTSPFISQIPWSRAGRMMLPLVPVLSI